MNFKGKTVLITGACSGIGKIMTRKSLERGAEKLIAFDINKEGLKQLKQDFEHFGIPINGYQIDLNDYEKLSIILSKIVGFKEKIDILINNAGIVTGKYFHEQSHREIDKLMNINIKATMIITREIIPLMMKENTGIICNISSSASLIGNPKMSVYAASKWALTGWGECLRQEMKSLNKNIQITTIMPFFMNTGMFEGVRSRLIPIVNPEKAAEKIMHAIEKGRKIKAFPVPYWQIRLLQGIFPIVITDWIMDKIFGIYNTMDNYKGR